MNLKRIHFGKFIRSTSSLGKAFAVFAFLSAMFPIIVQAAEVGLAWDANAESDLAGYKIYYGTSSGNYSHSIDVGDTTAYTLTDLDEGVTYYLAATAYDTDDNESDFSKELVHTTAALNQSPQTPSVPEIIVKGYARTEYTAVAAASDPDGDEIEIRYDWGDEMLSGWGAFSRSHAWTAPGVYCLKAQAKDIEGALSAWSDCANITITANDQPPKVDVDSNQTQPSQDAPDPSQPIDQGGTVNDGDADDGGDPQPAGTGFVDADNDGMPDEWELAHGLDPLTNDAADDFDGDEISNLDEYNQGSAPDQHESNLEPDSPQLLSPADYETVGLTPLLETGEFYDSNVQDVHDQSQWKILRAADQFCVLDVTTYISLTSLRVPRLILEQDTDYIWQVRYIDNQGTASVWSQPGYFTTEFLSQDSDGNGVLDDQEVDPSADLDGDGVLDLDQTDIKNVTTRTGDFTVGISIREAENADALISVQAETPAETEVNYSDPQAPQFLAFDLIHFKLLVNEPGAEVLVTIHLSKPAYDDGIWYKYNPVQDEWQDYSDYTSFSADRKTAYLILTDGGFGDADGIANGVIVDPLALRTKTDHNSGSDSLLENVTENLDPTGTCFISAAAGRRLPGLGGEIHARQVTFVLILIVLGSFKQHNFRMLRKLMRFGICFAKQKNQIFFSNNNNA